jgi:hypothetical protein
VSRPGCSTKEGLRCAQARRPRRQFVRVGCLARNFYHWRVADEVVEVSIGPDGTVAMSVRGVAGMECLTQTEDLVQLLGGEIESRELTDEAFVEVEQDAQDRLWH